MPDAPDLPNLIAALCSPEAYPHPVRALHVVQTHTSCVFLTGEYVYKVKKPVNFGFLDYSTLEKRRRCCEQEVRLNRRLCPEVYLDVVPIGQQAGRLRVEALGPPVEWAVRMRQLPEADMLPARLAAGTVALGQVEQLAERLASFHGSAPADAAAQRAPGAPDTISYNVEENFTQTESLTGGALPPEHLTAVREYSRRFLAEHRERFLARMRGGRIRDGHGDLRAQNICLFPDLQEGIQILDCIEFNERFRYGDVAADLAYLAMDLDLAGRADLRRVLVDRYVEATGDMGLRGVLAFYQCYRAYVRGKIALLAAAEPEIPPEERETHGEMAGAAFDLARSYAERRDPPALLITVGFSGAGKSVLARELARRLPAVRIATDEVRKALSGVSAASRLPAAQYGAEQKRLVYEEVYRRAAMCLAQGEHVLLDATFLSAEERDRAAALARLAGAEFWVLECRCADEVIRQRLRERSAQAAEASDADTAVYEAQMRSYEPRGEAAGGELPPSRWLRIDTGHAVQRSARQVLQAFWNSTASAELRR